MVGKSYYVSGSLAGAAAALIFTFIHDLFISNIWFMLLPMLFAGAACGFSIAWSYTCLVDQPSLGSWLRYNGLYLVMFVLLSMTSVLVFDPVTTVDALIAANEPADELITQALPMTLLFSLVIAVLLGQLYTRSWRNFAAILVTCLALVLLLGLNISIIGLVNFPSSALYLVAEMFGLILALNLVFVVVFLILERKRFYSKDSGISV